MFTLIKRWWMAAMIIALAGSAPAPAQVNPVHGIRAVDFGDFSYPASCWKTDPEGFEKVIAVKDGGWTKTVGAGDNSRLLEFDVNKPVYGNLTGEGAAQENAVVLGNCFFGNQGEDEIFVYGLPPGAPEPKLLAQLGTSDWDIGSYHVTKVQIQNGQLLVTYTTGGSYATPAWTATAAFRWNGTKFVRSGVVRKIPWKP